MGLNHRKYFMSMVSLKIFNTSCKTFRKVLKKARKYEKIKVLDFKFHSTVRKMRLLRNE